MCLIVTLQIKPFYTNVTVCHAPILGKHSRNTIQPFKQNNNILDIDPTLLIDKTYNNNNKFTDKNGLASIHIQITEKTEIFVKFDGSEIYHESISEVIILESSNNNEINSISEISNRLFLFIAVITLGMAGSVVLYIISRKK